MFNKMLAFTLVMVMVLGGMLPTTKAFASSANDKRIERLDQSAIEHVAMSPQARSSISVEWGEFVDYFYVSQPQIERQKVRDQLTGQISTSNMMVMVVEAKGWFMSTAFQVNFLDAEGISVADPAFVQFNPDYNGSSWNEGQRSRASVLLPPNLAEVSIIQFIKIF